MVYLAIAYPEINQADYDWIQDIRKKYDERYFDVIKPHFTIVFGTSKLNIEDLTQHIRKKLEALTTFEFSLDSVKVVEDDSKEFFHTFLVPSTGYEEIIKIHDELYTGPLESELRHDIPFIPHVGVGTSYTRQEAEALAMNIAEAHRPVVGTIKDLTVVEFDGSKVSSLEKISLRD